LHAIRLDQPLPAQFEGAWTWLCNAIRAYPAEGVAPDKGGYNGTCGQLCQAKLVMKNGRKLLLSAVSACRQWRAKMCFERLRSCGKVNRVDHGNLLSRGAAIRRIAR
jgi:hypothetical protein